MLTPADLALVRRDRALPGLATLLDPDAFAAALAPALAPHLPRTRPVTASSSYIRYKPGTNCLVSYRLQTPDTQVMVHAKAHGPDAEDKLAKAREKPGTPSLFGAGRVVLEEEDIVVSFFPNDAKLKSLPRIADTGSRRELLGEILPDSPELWDGALQTLRYKPERRYVARLIDGGRPRVTLKTYTQEGYRAAETNAQAFVPGGALRLARRLGSCPRHNTVAFEWRQGLSLKTALAEPESAEGAVRTAGAALAGLHAQEGRGLEYPGREEEVDALIELHREMEFICPALSRRMGELVEHLTLRLSLQPSERRPIHGDFYDEQVLLSGEEATILDLDRAALGDPAADLGLFAAHLERDALRGELRGDQVEPLKAALLEGYRDAGGQASGSRVSLYTIVGLLKLSPEPFRRRDTYWPEGIRAILERARYIARSLSVPAASR